MKRSQLIDLLSHSAQLKKSQAEKILSSLSNIIDKELRTTGEFSLSGIGKIYVAVTDPRPGRDIRKGKGLTIPSRKVVRFKASKKLNRSFNPEEYGNTGRTDR